MTYRNRKLLNLAHRVYDCQIVIPGVCEVYAVNGCEPVHSNWQRHGRGIGHKTADLFHAAGCHSCHVAIDADSKLSREEKQDYWFRGWEKTLEYYFEQGWLIVGGKNA